MSLIIDITPMRGLTRVSGVVPNGHVVVTRESAGTKPFTLRDGVMDVVNNGFSLEDSEAPIGVPVTYIATDAITDRRIARNLVLTPDVRIFGQQTWLAGQSRAATWGTGIITLGSNAAGATQGLPGRTIGSVGLGTLAPNTQYLVTGKIKFTTPDVWTWQDVRNAGTWSAVRTAKANWQAVRSTLSGAATSSMTTLSVGVVSGATTVIAPTVAITAPMNRTNEWFTFAVYVTTPATIPANARLQLYHGTDTREFAISWSLDEFGMMTRADTDKLIRLFWFKGNTPVPDRPQDYLTQDTDWDDVSRDARILWEGTPGASVSRFEAPSTISVRKTITIVVPSQDVPCEPVLLSDPVSSSLAQWFGLASVGTLSRAARSSVLSVLGREDYVAQSSVRGGITGTLELFTDTLMQRANAEGLLKSGRVLLLRNPDPAYPESNWYIAIGDVDEDRTIEEDARRPERTWTVPFVRVERPVGMIEVSTGITWAQIKASGMTWQQLRERRENWLQATLVAP